MQTKKANMLNINLYASGDTSISKVLTSYNVSNLVQNTNKEKTKSYSYRTNARKCRASASLMQDKFKKIWLITLTISNEIEHTHSSINKSFNLFTKNLKKTYGNTSYIATAETQKNGSIHYHVLATFKTNNLDFAKITNAWNIAISNVHNVAYNAVNSVRFGGYNKKTKKRYYFINNIEHAIKYITKYITKCNGEAYTAKSYFISYNIRDVHVNYKCNDYLLYNYFLSIRSGAVFVNEHVIMFNIDAKIALDFIYEEHERKKQHEEMLCQFDLSTLTDKKQQLWKH
jgi:hypothetical protein